MRRRAIEYSSHVAQVRINDMSPVNASRTSNEPERDIYPLLESAMTTTALQSEIVTRDVSQGSMPM